MSKTRKLIMALALTLIVIGMMGLLSSCTKKAPEIPTSKGPLNASAALSTNSLYVGDPLRLVLSVDHPAGAQLTVPDISNGRDLIIRNQQTESEELTPEIIRTVTTYDLTSLAVGQHVVSSNIINCVTAEGERLTEPFPFQSFEVVTLIDEPDVQVRAIKDITNWPDVFPRSLLVFLLVALIAAIAGMVVRRILNKRRTILHYPPPTPPHEIALRELRSLRTKGWIEEANAEPFYVELSGIVRRYLEKRFDLRAPERTTEEFIREAANSRVLNTAQQLTVREFLEQSDLVKFAKHHPQKEDMETAYGAAEHLVVETAELAVEEEVFGE